VSLSPPPRNPSPAICRAAIGSEPPGLAVQSEGVKYPIRHQLLLPLVITFSLAVLGVAAVSAWLGASRQLDLLNQRQAEVLDVLQGASFPVTRPVLQQMARLSGQQFVVWDRQRRVIVESSFDESTDLAAWIGEVVTLDEAAAAGQVQIDGTTYSIRETRLNQQPDYQVLVLTSHQLLADARWQAVWPPMAVGAGALLILVPWLLVLTRGWSRRIVGIQQCVSKIAEGDLSAVPDTTGRDDELAALVTDIRQMSQRLQELQGELVQVERERLVAQLTAGFAHQFRNGVMGAAAALELHGTRCVSADDRSLAQARRQLALLKDEIAGLLSLARREKPRLENVNIGQLLDEAVDMVSPIIEHHHLGLQIATHSSNECLPADRERLRSAVLNLLLNAIDAAGPNGHIQVGTSRSGNGLAILVKDSGPGPSREIADCMTTAFSTTKPSGVGLGLTVVATVAKDHGGRLTWRRESDWTVMELWLPTSPREELSP
jgi:signal transduction histidine kinase